MDNEITVRKAVKADAAALAGLLRQVGKVHSDGRPDIYRSPLTKYDEKAAEDLIADESAGVYVAECGGTVVGETIFRIMSREGDGVFLPRKWLYIDDLCVDENSRGGGAALALVEQTKRIAENEGCGAVELNCWAFNTRAAKFYEKAGFRPQKTEYEFPLSAETTI